MIEKVFLHFLDVICLCAHDSIVSYLSFERKIEKCFAHTRWTDCLSRCRTSSWNVGKIIWFLEKTDILPLFSKEKYFGKSIKPPSKNPHSKWGFFFIMTNENYLHRFTKRFRTIENSIIQHRFQRKILRENLIFGKRLGIKPPCSSWKQGAWRVYKNTIELQNESFNKFLVKHTEFTRIHCPA